jgi:hypothetical protein
LVIIDGGYLGAWSARAAPSTVDPAILGIVDPQTLADIASAVDFEVVGPDAEAAARSFDRQAGLTLYDIPGSRADAFADGFATHCRGKGLDAHLQRFPEQLPHRDRVRRAVADRGVDEFLFFGIPAVALGRLPADRPLTVCGVRSSGDGFEGSWDRLLVRISDVPAVQSVEAGVVGVDWARLMFADADALSAWQHDDPIDGLADVAFWGRHAAEAAAAFDAPLLGAAGEQGVHGWSDLPVEVAAQRAVAIEAWKDAGRDRWLKVDFRPHSHHWQVMAGVRASVTQAAAAHVGGADVLMAMTSWGDGMFPVVADFDHAGGLVAVRVEFRNAKAL